MIEDMTLAGLDHRPGPRASAVGARTAFAPRV